MSLRRIVLACLAAVSAAVALAGDTVSYVPEIHGTLRPRFEWDTSNGLMRFSVRNARLSVNGLVAPVLGYFVQLDACNRGKFNFLDAYAFVDAAPKLRITAGQTKMPFSVDGSRAPHLYYFANRSYLARQNTFRRVGVKGAYTLPFAPMSIESGVFSNADTGNHSPWGRTIAASARADYRIGNVTAEVGFLTISPDSVRANSFDVSIAWKAGRWYIQGEYLHKHYTHHAFAAHHAYTVTADYSMPVRAGIFSRLSFQGRADGMNAHSDGHRDADGRLFANQPRRNRLTLGSTISYIHQKVRCDLRLNYEHVFYPADVTPPANDCSKIVAEIVVRF